MASLESTIAGDGCLMQWVTPASSSYWWNGVWGTNTNDFNIWFNYTGLSTKSNGSAAKSGNLDVGVDAASPIVKAHVNHEGPTGFIHMEARYRNQSFLSFEKHMLTVIYSFELRMNITCIVAGTSHIFYKPTYNVSDDRLKGNEVII